MGIGRCNYCNLRSLRRAYERDGDVVSVRLDEHGWKAAYVHPDNVDIDTLSIEQREPYYKAGYMELSDHCCC